MYPGVRYLPPAARGDVLRASERFAAVLLIDGVFHHDLAPTPKEVFAACGRTRMSGAASMGALRAAECARYGMRPLGAITRWYLRGRIDGDDEVAVLVDPREQRALSVPMVNVRFALWLALRRGLLSREQRDEAIARARSVFYMERTWDDVVEAVPEKVRVPVMRLALAEGDLKRADARFALRCAVRDHQRFCLRE